MQFSPFAIAFQSRFFLLLEKTLIIIITSLYYRKTDRLAISLTE